MHPGGESELSRNTRQWDTWIIDVWNRMSVFNWGVSVVGRFVYEQRETGTNVRARRGWESVKQGAQPAEADLLVGQGQAERQ